MLLRCGKDRGNPSLRLLQRLSMEDASRTGRSRPLWAVVLALGVTQILAWGSLHYSIAVLAPGMAREMGLSVTAVLGCYTAALVVSGLLARPVGQAVDRLGGRRPMALGSVAAALALALIASAPHPALFLAGWLLAGAAMAATLYDAAFATLGAVSGERHRQALTALTLLGGFASTVFWPLSYALDEALGWRGAVAVFAALQLLVCLPLHAGVLPDRRRPAPQALAPAPPLPSVRRGGSRGLGWLAASFALNAMLFSAMSVHLLGTLAAAGLSAREAVAVSVLVGPMQVAGRVLEFLGGRALKAVTTGFAALAGTLVAMLLLGRIEGPGAWAIGFALLYGASNGVMTIVRGTVPAELYGREDYGALLGRLAGPSFIGKAAAPVALAFVAERLGHPAAVAGLGLLAALSLGAYGIAVRHAGRRGASPLGAPAGEESASRR